MSTDIDAQKLRELFEYQDKNIEWKWSQEWGIGSYMIMCAGDIFRELCQVNADSGYTGSKISSLKKDIKSINEADLRELEMIKAPEYIEDMFEIRKRVKHLIGRVRMTNLGRYEDRKEVMIVALCTLIDVIDFILERTSKEEALKSVYQLEKDLNQWYKSKPEGLFWLR